VTEIKIVHIADTHAGAFGHERFEAELDAAFFAWLEANDFDAVVHGGDLFDRRLDLNSGDAKAAIRTAFRIAQACQRRGVPFRILKGTLTHDYDQLANLLPFETEFPCFRVVQTTSAEELLPGFRVLYMPEVYPTDYADHYSQFLYAPAEEGEWGEDVVYDAIFGHGQIDVAAGWGAVIEGERHYGGTPTHEAERLLQHCRGPVQFGHVHNRFRYKKRLGYSGSFSRWCQGEEGKKGFDVLSLSGEIGGAEPWAVRVQQVVNALAPVYRTVVADQILDASDPPDAILAKIRAAAAGCHRLRVKLGDFPIGVEEFSIVRGALVEDGNVDLQTSARAAPQRAEAAGGDPLDEAAALAAAEERRERVSYLRDQTVPAPERLLRYIAEGGNPAGVTLEDIVQMTAPAAG
jgi:hypothetical protein